MICSFHFGGVCPSLEANANWGNPPLSLFLVKVISAVYEKSLWWIHLLSDPTNSASSQTELPAHRRSLWNINRWKSLALPACNNHSFMFYCSEFCSFLQANLLQFCRAGWVLLVSEVWAWLDYSDKIKYFPWNSLNFFLESLLLWTMNPVWTLWKTETAFG